MRGRVGATGLVVAASGAVLVLLAFTLLDWFRSGSNSPFFRSAGTSTFGDISGGFDGFRQRVAALSPGSGNEVHFGVADVYFGWLGWLLFALCCCATTAALASSARVVGVVGLLLGLGAAAVTVWALNLVTFSGHLAQMTIDAPTFWGYLKHSAVGAWLAIIGFVLLGVGAALGTRRDHAAFPP